MNKAGIGTLREKSLHAGLKRWLAEPGDRLEHSVDGYVIDIVRGEQLLEIQTRSFSNLKRKLAQLLPDHPIQLFYPLPRDKWIVRVSAENTPISRRKSPKHSRPIDAFRELVYIGHLLPDPNLNLTLLMTQEEEVWRDDGKGSWRRKRWSIADRHLLDVVDEVVVGNSAELLALLPAELDDPFTNRELAQAARCPNNLAQKTTYTLRQAGVIEVIGKKGNAYLFSRMRRS
jgi:hypothetical protein